FWRHNVGERQMGPKNPLKGQIQVLTGKKKLLFPFKFLQGQLPSFGETLIGSFAAHRLTPDEKKLLTRDMRALLALMQSVPPQEIHVLGEQFCEFLNSIKGQNLDVKARGLGAHICLAALLGGALLRSKHYS